MKLSILPLLLITSFTLYSQEIIEPGEDIMGAFNAPGTECYELFIEEAGEYLLSYNLMNVNIKVIYNGQELFSDYMAIFATDPKKAQIIFQNPGTYQICFSTTGTMAVYQCRIVKADNIVPGEAIPVKYGEYVLKEISADDSPVNYSFSGKADDKIRIGISGMFVANLKITSPSKTVLYDQSFAAPPPNGLKLDFELEENGDYLITVTPGWGFQQYSLSLYLLEPVQASFIKFNELYAGALANFGVNYLRFYACTGDTLQINYTGSTAYTTMQVITPGGETVICKDIIDENHIAHTLPVEEDGTYVVVISYDMQGILGYGLSVEMKPEFYKLSRFIIREMAHLYKKVYSFHASRNDILRIGLDLPSRILELKDPGGEIILRLDSTSSDNDKSLSFNEITLESTGIYLITIWHDFTGYSPVEMRFCASLVPEPSVIEIDNMYHISVPPYHRYPYSFNAEADHVIRIILPEASPMVTPAGDVITVNTGKTHMVQQSGNFTISAINSLTVTAETDILLKTIVPPENAVPLEIGKIFKDNIELYETPSIVYNGIAGDTVFVQAEIKELILSPNVGNIINTPSWLYVTRPSGGLLRIEGKPTGRISDNGYLITYSFKKNIILDQSGNHFMTLCMDKEVTENTVDVTMRIDRGGASIEVPFGTYSDYEVPGNYYCSVPQGLEKLFVILKRSNNIGYDQTWHG
ncbi:MAG TPA: hypothetical protein PLZ75_11340, partial [Bacteroidales bacterium]|nr:hypothetical protein [Bacteroidales bacterium]